MTKPRLRATLLTGALMLAAGCAGAGKFLEELFRERPPLALESLPAASDARIDTTGRLLGSFIGEGTTREVHLLSTDTALIAALVRRTDRRAPAGNDLWRWLDQRGVLALNLDAARQGLVGSPDGHSVIALRAALIRGGRCGPASAQAELIVEDARGGGPSLRGPVLGSFRDVNPGRSDVGYRDEPRAPGPDLLDSLVSRAEHGLDSLLARRLPSRALPLLPLTRDYQYNTLEDVDAADVVPFRVDASRIRYAVGLRTRRLTASGDTLVAATLMVFDSAGAWQQFVFRPTAVMLRRGRLVPYAGLPPLLWHRLTPIDAFAYERDDLWLEQVDISDGTVVWGVIEPRFNVPVAAAEIAGPCRS
ncbi:MAG TPA: hypothetical protein VJN95_14475 [Gemmatimonadales bacterium]|nr:hypothetical protein [Gemmatimonadales bacterium]